MSPLGGGPSTSTSPPPSNPHYAYFLLQSASSPSKKPSSHDPSSNWGDRSCCGWNLSFLLQIHLSHFSQLGRTTSTTLDILSDHQTYQNKVTQFLKKHIFNNTNALITFSNRDTINEIMNITNINISKVSTNPDEIAMIKYVTHADI